MSPDLAMNVEARSSCGMGQLYKNREDASRAGESYRNDNFEVRLVEEDGKFLVYTRRVVKEVVVAAQ